MNLFLESRKSDIRTNEVENLSNLKQGKIFYITCIDEQEKLNHCMINIKANIIVYIKLIFIPRNSGWK